MSHSDDLQECWNQANPDEDDRTDEEIEVCHTVDDRTRQVITVYCWGDRTVVVTGDRILSLVRT